MYVIIITADGKKTISTESTVLDVSSISESEHYKISDILVIDKLPSTGLNCPTDYKISCFANAKDLINLDLFSTLSDSNLQNIIGIKEAKLFLFDSKHNHVVDLEPYVAHCKLGWSVYSPDKWVNFNTIPHYIFVRLTNEELDAKIDRILENQISGKPV